VGSFYRRKRGERGAAAVEFALIAMPLIILLFVIVEAAFLMKDYVSVSSAVRSGARTASASAGAGKGTCDPGSVDPCTPANAPKLAQAAAAAAMTNGTALNSEDIAWVIVYKPNPNGNGYPIGQTSLTCGTSCVKYVWNPSLGRFSYSSGSWASATINACVNDSARDSVGVGMRVNHQSLTGFFGSGITIEEHTVMQFEPLESSTCAPGAHE
jgi:hypothetical protein